MPGLGYLLDLGTVAYEEAWALQRSLAAAVGQGAIPDSVILLEHPPTITLGRSTGENELHVPDEADVTVVETARGGKSTFHGPGQLVCYPILELTRHAMTAAFLHDDEDERSELLAELDDFAARHQGGSDT